MPMDDAQPARPCATAEAADVPAACRDPLAGYLGRILRAPVYDVAIESPLEPARRLSARLGGEVLLKREDLQPVFSFKLRGAYNRIARLSEAEAARGVVCASAGNHAQGVALAASRRGIPVVVVMPETTPRIKVEAVRALGAAVLLHGDDFDQASARAREIEAREGRVFVHPFDDPDVIAGQGTIAMEILRQRRGETIEAIYVPVGGGGLVAGVAAYVKSLFPAIRVVGVEPEDAPTLHAALAAGRPVTLPEVGLFADGCAVRRIGEETFRLARAAVDDVILVSTDAICAAIQDLHEDTRSAVEPAGALALAGLKQDVARRGTDGGARIAIVSGANLNFDRLRHIAERAELGQLREMLLAVTIPERPGSFRAFCRLLGRRNVTEFNYRYADPEAAHIFVGLELDAPSARAEVLSALATAGLPAIDLSHDELAKLHVRHLVGGPAPGLADERLFRFEFPERPGALARFLDAIGARWNISLFHYRNHGSDFGRVLAGIQVPASEADAFAAHLAALGYRYVEETGSPAHRLFLGGSSTGGDAPASRSARGRGVERVAASQ
jgi:threonine dehydratase